MRIWKKKKNYIALTCGVNLFEVDTATFPNKVSKTEKDPFLLRKLRWYQGNDMAQHAVQNMKNLQTYSLAAVWFP